jgi:DNA primase
MILVEGHLDVVSLYQAGIKNAVASMGTALTQEQCNEIKRNADLVYVSFDGDSAGQAATLKGLSLLKNTGVELKVVELTGGLDPDDYVRKFGLEGYEKLLSEALSFPDYRLKLIENKYDLTKNEGKAKYLKDALEVLGQLDEVERAVYIELVSEKSGVAIDGLKRAKAAEVKQDKKEKPRYGKVEVEGDYGDSSYHGYGSKALLLAARFILASAVTLQPYVSAEDVDGGNFTCAEHKKICEYIMACASNKRPPTETDLFDFLEGDLEVSEVLRALDCVPADAGEVFYKESLEKIKKMRKNKERDRLIAELNTETDEGTRNIIKMKILKLTAQPKK